MATVEVICLHCSSTKVIKYGRNKRNKQTYRCQNASCQRCFILDYCNRGHLSSVRQQIVDMALNGSGIRDTARVLGISAQTVMNTLKKNPAH